MIYYLLVGLGVYLAASASNPNSFKGASLFAIAKGAILGMLLWPIGLVLLYLVSKEK